MLLDFAHLRLAFAPAPGFRSLNLATQSNSQVHSTKGTQSGIPPCGGIALPLLVGQGFQVLFHSPPGVLFTFPSRYCFTIGHQGVFSLGWWSTQLPTGFHVPRGTQDPARLHIDFRVRGYHPLWPAFPVPFFYPYASLVAVLQPRHACTAVWALPLSLAATEGISFDFFSWRYMRCFNSLRLAPFALFCSDNGAAGVPRGGFPHSVTPGSQLVCSSPRLFAACHDLHRLPDAKASALGPYFA